MALQKRQGRTSRHGLLSEKERKYISGEIKCTPKQEWEFLNVLKKRLEYSAVDVKLIWEHAKKDQRFETWVFSTWKNLYSITEPIRYKHYLELQPYNLGRVKFKTIKKKNQKRGTRLYWFDEFDEKFLGYKSQTFPSHQLREIKPRTVKDTLKIAFEIEDRFHRRKTPIEEEDLKFIIIPRIEKNAKSLNEIKQRILETKKILKID